MTFDPTFGVLVDAILVTLNSAAGDGVGVLEELLLPGFGSGKVLVELAVFA